MARKGVGVTTLEKKVEQHLRDSVRALGGWCLKLVCPGFTGMPDRLPEWQGSRVFRSSTA